jgi:hypothetical protein
VLVALAPAPFIGAAGCAYAIDVVGEMKVATKEAATIVATKPCECFTITMPSFINSIREELAFGSDYLLTLNLNICQREKRAQIWLKIMITQNHADFNQFLPG